MQGLAHKGLACPTGTRDAGAQKNNGGFSPGQTAFLPRLQRLANARTSTIVEEAANGSAPGDAEGESSAVRESKRPPPSWRRTTTKVSSGKRVVAHIPPRWAWSDQRIGWGRGTETGEALPTCLLHGMQQSVFSKPLLCPLASVRWTSQSPERGKEGQSWLAG